MQRLVAQAEAYAGGTNAYAERSIVRSYLEVSRLGQCSDAGRRRRARGCVANAAWITSSRGRDAARHPETSFRFPHYFRILKTVANQAGQSYALPRQADERIL